MNLHRFEVGLKEKLADPRAEELRAELSSLNLPTPTRIRTANIYWVEADFKAGEAEAAARELFHDEVVEKFSVDRPVYDEDSVSLRVEIVPRPGVMDPVAGTIRKALADRNLRASFAATGRKYLFFGEGLDQPQVREAVHDILVNDCVEETHFNADAPVHRPGGKAEVRRVEVPLAGKGDKELEALSRKHSLALSVIEMRAMQAHYKTLGRAPTDVELETIAQTWSEHCRHKTLMGAAVFTDASGKERRFQNILKETIVRATHKIAHPDCLSVFKDNAGVVAFDERFGLTFKVETHNHPSALDPYGGSETGVGGVIRDTLGTGLGAKPIAGTDVFCFGPPDMPARKVPPGVIHPRKIMDGVVAGVRDYGNRMGIPTLNGAIHFDPGYVGNPLVFCGSIGLIPRDRLEKAPQIGDWVVVTGGRTGRDGIHGATFSSEELTSESERTSSGAVQIGNAIEEKRVLDALLRSRDLNLHRCVTDCGAGGLSSAVGEMASELGAEVQLETVPLKYGGLTPAEIWISEAQERMVFAVPPEHWARFADVCRAEDVEAVKIGRFTGDGILRLKYGELVVGELDMKFLHDGLPKVERKACLPKTETVKSARTSSVRIGSGDLSFGNLLRALLKHPTLASKESVIRQYDHEVQGRTSLKPLIGPRADGPGDAAVITPVLGSPRAAVIACGLCPQLTANDPYIMAQTAVDEALRNAYAVGGDPARTFLLDNFCWGNTEKPEQLGTLIRCCEGAADAAGAFGTPFISGKDSLNNEFSFEGKTVAIPGTLLISSLSVIDDVRICRSMELKKAGHALYQLGFTRPEMGGSYVHLAVGLEAAEAPLPPLDAVAARKLYAALHRAFKKELICSCHDLSEGGLATAAAESAFAGNCGAHLDLTAIARTATSCLPSFVLLFAETPSRFLVEVAPDKTADFEAVFSGLPCSRIGEVTAKPVIKIEGAAEASGKKHVLLEESCEELRRIWLNTL
jgi:phosphoribosylformylglycinamidine synthase